MTKLLAAFHDFLLPELPGCTIDMLNLQLVQVAREFCHTTSAWRLALDPISLQANNAVYDFEAPETQAEPVRLTKMTINGELLWQDDELPEDMRRQSTTTVWPKYQRHEPPFTLSNDLTEITLTADEVPTTALTAGMVLEGVFKPTMAATQLPDFLHSQYSEAMRYGVLSRLMLMGGKKWTDRDLASAYRSQYQSALNFAAYQGQVGNTRQHLRVKNYG